MDLEYLSNPQMRIQRSTFEGVSQAPGGSTFEGAASNLTLEEAMNIAVKIDQIKNVAKNKALLTLIANKATQFATSSQSIQAASVGVPTLTTMATSTGFSGTAEGTITVSDRLFVADSVILIPSVQVAGGAASFRVDVATNITGGQQELTVTLLNSTDASSLSIPAFTNVEGLSLGYSVDDSIVSIETIKRNPSVVFNFVQTFLGLVKMTDAAAKQDKVINTNMQYYINNALLDFALQKEMAYLFGTPSKTITADGVAFTTAGVFHQITNKLLMPAGGFTHQSITNMVDFIFSANNGNPERAFICGSEVLRMLQYYALSTSNFNFNATEFSEKIGINTSTIDFNGKRLNVIEHPLMRGSYSNKACTIDLDCLEQHVFQPFSTLNLELKKSNQFRGEGLAFHEQSGILLNGIDQQIHSIIEFAA